MDRRVQPLWSVLEPDEDACLYLERALSVPKLTARLLVNRGITEPSAAQRFLEPRLKDMPDPFSMKGMRGAVERILRAIEGKERICVWGDYDVDGVTSASQLLLFFQAIGVEAGFFVPDRFVDGYGLSGERIAELAKRGVDLFVTVDCGVSNRAEVEVAREHGAEVIIVDHHQVPDEHPRAVAMLDPHQPGCEWPEKQLAACGVTWVLLIALRAELRKRGYFKSRREPDLRDWLDLTAIGTVADVVPLTGLNRVIVRYGLMQMADSRRVGVRALCEVSGLESARITAGRIGFQLGPRINAAGRIAQASAGVELLTTTDEGLAKATAAQVDAFNAERRAIQDQIFEQACQLVEDAGDPAERRSVVLAHPEWHPGVLGIVASKLVERYYRPTILMSVEDGVAKGSARSISGFKLVHHLRRLERFLDKYGGHDHAAGLSISAERLPGFTDAFEAEAREHIPSDRLVPRLRIDAEVPVAEISFQLVEGLQELAPFGMGNPEPTLMARQVRVMESRVVGKDQTHLKLTLDQGMYDLDAIAFSMAHIAPEVGSYIDLVYVPEINVYQGRRRLQARVKALRPSA